MKTQYISASSNESDNEGFQRLSEDQWVSCHFLASNLFNIWLDKCENTRQVFTEYLLLKPDW